MLKSFKKRRYYYRLLKGCTLCKLGPVWRVLDKQRPEWHMDFKNERDARRQADFMNSPLPFTEAKA